jgi:hypothetical protein
MPYALLHHVFQQCVGYWRAPVPTARCIPAPNYDITSLIINEDEPDPFKKSYIDGTFDPKNPYSTVPIEVTWRLACMW